MLRRISKNLDSKGFTIVELMVVTAIVGVLAAIAIPGYSSYKDKAYNSTALSDLRCVKATLETYYADIRAYP